MAILQEGVETDEPTVYWKSNHQNFPHKKYTHPHQREGCKKLPISDIFPRLWNTFKKEYQTFQRSKHSLFVQGFQTSFFYWGQSYLRDLLQWFFGTHTWGFSGEKWRFSVLFLKQKSKITSYILAAIKRFTGPSRHLVVKSDYIDSSISLLKDRVFQKNGELFCEIPCCYKGQKGNSSTLVMKERLFYHFLTRQNCLHVHPFFTALSNKKHVRYCKIRFR